MKKRIRRLFCADLLLLSIIAGFFLQNFFAKNGNISFWETQETGSRLRETDPAAVSDQLLIATEKKQIALTFDDGPDEIYTPMLLDGLKERNIKATFFLLGKQVEKYPDLVKRISDEGHIIGCHSYEHVNFKEIPEETACEQIDPAGE